MKKSSAKRVNIVSVKLVRESCILYAKRSIRSPQDAYELLKSFLEDKDREHFIVVTLDTKNQPVSINVCHIGSLNASIVSPREVMKSAILSSGASFMIAHNHPSGNTTESREDVEVTKRLAEAGKLMGIELLDHIIIGDGKYNSLKEKGVI
ncbi:DNA repair protein RadC [Priestia flexa]|jgi:DNA repair protein RadC|uniref:JAB domain-containing protein n=1 Tax=Priestia flexa TaxID=86664 RepID=UPI000956DAF6|nr:DNA repair protein RadC [Priestia flexa]UIR29996.1 DNA repair protein RadC [Priestia flexa]SIR32117.1 DNA repair protein RadC [Priestia flexa]